ncbi:universal stress protein [Noviherbaspirillum massiliense]|uniref:universal stress protein n=1 Tax=Noviherbaspirillum massiliense TaxID=1465823 RepID=UPI0002E20A18|nr:universal stress protein [Noviherbaspirillum massiliense]
MFRKILVPTDGSELSGKAIKAAVELAGKIDGSIVGLCVSEPYPYSPLSEGAIAGDAATYEARSRELAQRHVQKVKDAAAAANVPCEAMVAQSFSPFEEIIDVARNKGCDVIFMASHGRKGLNRLFIGSETQKVLAHSDIPVMVFR